MLHIISIISRVHDFYIFFSEGYFLANINQCDSISGSPYVMNKSITWKKPLKQRNNILPNSTLIDFSQYLSTRSISVKNTINDRHTKKFTNLQSEYGNSLAAIDKSKWVVNISSKPLTNAERQILGRGPKFATAPNYIPYKKIVAEIEFSIRNLPEESQESIRSSTASILDKSRLPARNTTLEKRKALKELKKRQNTCDYES